MKMTPERWQKIDTLLQTVAEHSQLEREALLEEACSADQTLRQEVESLIIFREKAKSFLERPALEQAADLLYEDRASSMTGQLFGSYRIEAQLGVGGMGEVYLAEDTKLDRKVAIKFLPPYLEENELAKKRLMREARAAAQLDHPNICAVHEVTEVANRTFIVLQYISGGTLSDRIKQQPLQLLEALDLSIQVVDALAEAHSRGIIHRDIKPGNIMITSRGQVKVLDFGLAKLAEVGELEQSDADRSSTLSRAGERPGTPPYMSPEQARGLAVDARSDLFAVGVILYECVAGRRPFSGKTDLEILAQVIHFHPPQPSKVNPNIPSELDAIILRALAKEPGARYQSASDLLEDLRAMRLRLQAQNEAVTRPFSFEVHAPKASTLTTLSNVLRQRPVFMSATGLVLGLALLAYFVVAPKLLPKPYRAPERAIFWYDKGIMALRNGSYYEASKTLEQAVATDEKFALAHARLAEAYSELDYSDAAKNQIIRAQSLARDLKLDHSDSLYLKAVTSTVLRDFAPAVESYQQIARQASDQEKANVYLDLGKAYEKNDQLKEAKENYQQATRLAPQEPASFLRLGIVCSQLYDFASASEAFQKAESIYQNLSNLEGVTEVFYQRGLLFVLEIKPPEARVQLEKALELTKATGDQYQVIRVLQLLSTVSVLEGHIAQAQQQAAEAIQLARNNGIENQATSGLIFLGNAFLWRGDYSDAEKYYQQGLELAQRDKLRVSEAWALTQLGSLRSLQHKTDEALHYCEKALVFYQEGGYRKWLSLTLPILGRSYRDRGDYDAALNAFKQLHQLGEQLGDQAQTGLADVDIGNVLSYEEQYSEALRHFDESYRIFKSLNADSYIAYAAQNRASVLWQLGRAEDAKAALDEAASIVERRQDTNKQLLAYVYLTNSFLELSDGHIAESKAKSRKALDLAGNQYVDVAVQAKRTLALAQARSGSARSARLLCEDAVNIAAGTGDPQLLSGSNLSLSETMLAEGELQSALDTALRAQESFARYGKSESEWRALLIAAEASQRLGNTTAAHEYSSRAVARLSDLEQKWGSEAYNGYLARSDITHFRNQLDQLLKP